MYLFKDLETLLVVERDYKINTEALDGLLEYVEDTNTLLAIEHIPNSNWSYNVSIKEEGYADIIWNSYRNLISDKQEKPIKYLNIILKNDLEKYVKNNNFYLVKINVKKTDPIIHKTINMPKKSVSEKLTNEKPLLKDPTTGYFKLLRDDEPLIYKFKSPNKK